MGDRSSGDGAIGDDGDAERSGVDAADELFAAHLDAIERGETADFDALCADHPDHADELRALEFAWSAVMAELEGVDLGAAQPWAPTAGGDEAPRYRIVGELGQGGMGVVYEVFDRELERSLAMKVLRGAAPRTSARCRRFVNEARITGRLQHPGIVPVHELGTDEAGREYFTLAKVEGLTFAEVIDRVHAGDPEWSQARAVSHLLRGCEAVAFAHSRGVVHRDLKPTNIMVGPFGETYVMDWGLARDLGPPSGHDATAAEGAEFATEARTADAPADGAPTDGAPTDGAPTGGGQAPDGDCSAEDVRADGALTDGAHSGGARAGGARAAGPPAEPALGDCVRPVPATAHQPPPSHPLDLPDGGSVTGASPQFEAELVLLQTLEGDVLGTPAYMPPEQARGRLSEVGPRSDVYAAGAVLYHLLAGRAPYGGRESSSPEEVLGEVDSGPPESLARVAPRAPVELRAIADRAMRRDPAQRYRDMGELSEDLRAWLEGRAVRAHATGPWTLLRKWVGRNRALATSIGAVALVVVGGVAWNSVTRAVEEARRGRLADLQLLRGFEVELEELDGALPDDGPALARWIEGATELVARAELHRRTVTKLDGRAARRAEAFDREGRATFADPDRAFEHGRVRELVAALDRFAASTGPLAAARERLDWIEELTVRTIEAPAEAWARAAAAVAADPRFVGVELVPQVGLVPLGTDPDGGLEAFLVARTGTAPVRVADGRLQPTESSGAVLLLVPGGDAALGVDLDQDPAAYEIEAPRHRVELEPFFIGKWELTPRQWTLLDRGPLAVEGDADNRLPAAMLTWTEIMDALPAHGLGLPSEAQWERAARGSTSTRFWWGDDVGLLLEHENAHTKSPWPVDRGSPNPFGLLNVLGNVAEWCDDHLDDYRLPTIDGAGRRSAVDPRRPVSVRNGVGFVGYDAERPTIINEQLIRTTMRMQSGADDAKPERGVRLARALRPSEGRPTGG